ncbi:MAG: peptidase S16 [Alphaproteobacteria bacterium]|nr:peptidase S16 [Alphaproteobacteria bacterium]
MAELVHATRFEELPAELPVFPLSGVLLLPRGRLPLNIFEPRYLAMIKDALAPPRLIGMIQPQDASEERNPDASPRLYGIGCAGRITSFSETEDGRFLITLAGVTRFEVESEIAMRSGYRRVKPRWDRFRSDFAPDESAIDRQALFKSLKPFFDARGLKADWDQVDKTGDERLIAMLSMICPFEPPEKQALLEAKDLAARTDILKGLLDMALATPPEAPTELRKH